MVKKDANYCCGGHWQAAGSQRSYATQPEQAPWQETWRPARPKSPRWRTTASPRRGGKGKGKDEPGGKGKSKAAARQMEEKQQPKAPVLEDLPAPPAAPQVSGPKRTQVESGASLEKTHLENLLKALSAASASLPEAAQQILAEIQQSSTQTTTRALHKAVAEQAKARTALTKVQSTRANYLRAWSEYMGNLTSLVEKQVQEQDTILEELDSAELQWSQAEQAAGQQLAKLTANDKEADEESRDMQISEDLVEEAIEHEARLQAASQERKAATMNMVQVLSGLRDSAAAQAREHAREGSRTPRRTAPQTDSSKDVPKEPPKETAGEEAKAATAGAGEPKASAPFRLGTQQPSPPK